VKVFAETGLYSATSPEKRGGSQATETFAFSSGGGFSGSLPKKRGPVKTRQNLIQIWLLCAAMLPAAVQAQFQLVTNKGH
jgi:hypothetical protein